MTDCIFCKIINRELPADIVYENDHIICFKDLYPKAPTHLLLCPKIHISDLTEIDNHNIDLLQHWLLAIPNVIKENGLDNGFRTIINTGQHGGQEVHHLHAHILGGTQLPSSIININS